MDRRNTAALLSGLLLLISSDARATPGERTEPLPDALVGVGVTERLGAQVPGNLAFVSAEGQNVTLDDVISKDRPTLLTLNYSDCPMLCNLQLNGLVEAMKAIDWVAGDQYDVVTVSLDPHESVERVRGTKDRYLKAYGRPAAEGWQFLVGDEADIRALAKSVGFGYRYLEDEKEYAHASVVVVLSPSGRVSRYLHGVAYSPQTLRLSMVEASQGKQVSALDSFVLFCFRYNASAGTYTPVVANLMKLGGVLTVILLGLFVTSGIIKKRRPKPRDEGVEIDVVTV